jgi:hypothetical protein
MPQGNYSAVRTMEGRIPARQGGTKGTALVRHVPKAFRLLVTGGYFED